MTHKDMLDQRLEELGKTIAPDSSFANDVMSRIAEAGTVPTRPSVGRRLARSVLQPRQLLVAGCLIVITVLWTLLPGRHFGRTATPWWSGPSSAYAESMLTQIAQRRVDGVVARVRTMFVMSDGTESTSSTVRTYFFARDRFRIDIFDDGKLREIQWYVPEGDQLVQTSYHMHDGSTSVDRHEYPTAADPIARLVEIVRYLDRANRRFEPKRIDGHECVGFEVDAFDTKIITDTYRVWFDTTTRLPVLVEFDRPSMVENIDRMITTFDRFEWDPRLPADTFAPHPVPDAAALKLE